MANLTLKKYEPNLFGAWNKFVETSNNGTIFHRQDFLAYHGDRFKKNEHHLVWFKGDQIFALMPLGIFEEKGKRVAKSPFGASWGGLVIPSKFKLKYAMGIVESLVEYLKKRKISEFLVTPTPGCYYQELNSYFEFALTAFGSKLVNRDILNVTKIPEKEDEIWQVPDRECRNKIKNALSVFKIKENVSAKDFYPILLADKRRHHSAPTHSLADLVYLQKNLKNKIKFDLAVNIEDYQAGICYFIGNKNCQMAFYMSQEDKAVGKNGINALVFKGFKNAACEGYRFMDFGISSINNQISNIGLVEFKESLGGHHGFIRDTYQLKIK